MTAARPDPLRGVRVVDLTRALAGPYATMLLAGLGADVIKVESPGGDESRGWLPFVDPAGGRAGPISAYYLAANRGKRSVTLDLKSDRDTRRLRHLLAGADVLVENFRPGGLDRLGIPLDRLRADHPRLITLSISGFGTGGPDGQRPGFDQIAQAEGGLMALTGEPDGLPTRIGLPITDLLAGLFGAVGVITALYQREQTGVGRTVTTSLLEAVTAIHGFHGAGWLMGAGEPGRTGNRHPSIAPYGTFHCADAAVAIGVASPDQWRRFATVVGIDPDHELFATNTARVSNVDQLQAEIDGRLGTRPAAEVLAALDARGIPCGRIRSVAEVWGWSQVQALGMVHESTHPELGEIRVPASALSFDGVRAAARLAPPTLGEHQHDLDTPWPEPGDQGAVHG